MEKLPPNKMLLDVYGLSKSFGGLIALNRVSFRLEEGSIVSMIGPNGAGKTTFINVVSGIFSPDLGEIYFQGQNIANLPAHIIASKGIGRTFQLVELFDSLSVLENVMIGGHTGSRSGMIACGFRQPSARREEKRIRDEAMECLAIIGLEKRSSAKISHLSLGERKLVGIARALNMKPRLLMLDEPAGGLAAHEIEKLVRLIYNLQGRGLTLFIIEHNMPFVMSLSERTIVLNGGSKIAEGPPDVIKTNDEVIKAYLGEEVS